MHANVGRSPARGRVALSVGEAVAARTWMVPAAKVIRNRASAGVRGFPLRSKHRVGVSESLSIQFAPDG